MADWLTRNHVFLEIALPMVIGNLQNKDEIQLKRLRLCTDWGQARNNVSEMFGMCKANGTLPSDLMHPVKMGVETLNPEWMKWFHFGSLTHTIN